MVELGTQLFHVFLISDPVVVGSQEINPSQTLAYFLCALYLREGKDSQVETRS